MAPYIEGSNRTFTGFKYWAITGHSDDKKPYDYEAARKRASEHAASFLADRGEEAAKAQCHMVEAGPEFLAALAGKDAPEEKRKIIGDLFVRIEEREIERM